MKKSIKQTLIFYIKQIALSILVGLCGGIIGGLFSKSVTYVTEIRTNNSWLVYFLVPAGILTVCIYTLFKISGMGTNQVLQSYGGENKLSPLLTPAIFICSVLSHLFGASVGREGAALQLGGGVATTVSKIFKLNDKERQMLTLSGMAGFFSAVFTTPVAAIAFVIEVIYVGRLQLKAVIPAAVCSFTAYFTALLLGTHPERITIETLPDITLLNILKAVIIAAVSGTVAMLFCYALKYSEKLFKKAFKNPFLRIAIGGIIIILLTLLFKTRDYNGAGMNVIERIFENGEFNYEAFLLKMIFTCVSVGAGYKGGEIVPTLFIGATFGALVSTLLGLPVALGAAVGMVSLFCGATNCPLAALLLGVELFSGKGFIFLIFASITAFFTSGKISLYSAQQRKSKKIS